MKNWSVLHFPFVLVFPGESMYLDDIIMEGENQSLPHLHSYSTYLCMHYTEFCTECQRESQVHVMKYA